MRDIGKRKKYSGRGLCTLYTVSDRLTFWTNTHVDGGMHTNNLVESWHNMLKGIFFGRKRNRRVDRLIHVLTAIVEPEFEHLEELSAFNLGPMNPSQKSEIARKQRALEVDADRIPELITRADEKNYVVSSLTSKENGPYVVEVENGEAIGCSCQDFFFTQRSCKHVYLLLRHDPSLSLPTDSGNIHFEHSGIQTAEDKIISDIDWDEEEVREGECPTEGSHAPPSSVERVEIVQELNKLKDSMHKLKSSGGIGRSESLDMRAPLQDMLELLGTDRVAPNSNLQVQRRF